ncbi:MAG: 50S ribosomal protein L13 [Patescibacteria group bacterium]
MDRKTHIIDAADQNIGRLATKIAVLLRGKHKSQFAPYRDDGDFVVVRNIQKMKWSGKKGKQKIYYRYSGYLGGMKGETLEKLFSRNPEKVLKKAVWGMLPENRLRPKQIQRFRLQ